MKKLLLLCSLCVFLYAADEYKKLEESDKYIIYCVNNYKWIHWNFDVSSFPVQMFEYHNGQSVPVGCK